MTQKAAPHEQAVDNRPILGTPRPLPRVILCHATVEFCGRYWIANTMDQYARLLEERRGHEVFCRTRATVESLQLPPGFVMPNPIR